MNLRQVGTASLWLALIATGWCRLAFGQAAGAPGLSLPEAQKTTAAAQAQATNAEADIAEWDQRTAKFDKIRTPDSPAFLILGVSPTEIQRPGTPMALATALSGFVSGSNLALPTNLALEVAPYWLYGHPRLTARDYEEGGWRNIYRTFTISIGTKQTARETADAGVTTAHTDSDLALGIRSRLYGAGPDRGAECIQQVEALQRAAQEVAKAGVIDTTGLPGAPGSPAFLEAFHNAQAKALKDHQALSDQLETARKKLDRRCFDVTATAQGFSLDVAGGLGWRFLDSVATSSNADLISGAGWLTAAYASTSFTGALLARYAGRQIDGEWQHVIDGGLRLVYKREASALSAEGVLRGRLSGPGGNTYKVDIVAEYKVAGESWVSVAFGRTFETGQPGAIFSLANLTWAFGKPSIQ